ncbi:MAG: phosphatidate cytidylyltransferase [Planctomycetota bacterium]|nr:phosphatidate cytidylyltransferase [Planctomycetota bacterium]
MLKYRLTLGPLLILLFLGIIWLDGWLSARGARPGLAFTVLMLTGGVFAGRELAKIFRARAIATSVVINSIAVCAGLVASSFTPEELGPVPGSALVCSAGAGVMLLAMLFYSRHHNVQGVVASTSATLLAFVYVGMLGGFLIVLVKEYSAWLVLAVVLITKSYDIGAYSTGRIFGRHKLIPWLSPGKTWEGLVGGVAFASLVGAATALVFGTKIPGVPPFSWWQGALVGAVFGLVGQAGDLVASLLKRDAGIKDYSRAIPGFGGIMDVVDSPLLVAPVAFWMLRALGTAGGG